MIRFFTIAGLTWFVPIIRLVTGEEPKEQLQEIWAMIGVPLSAIGIFLILWGAMAARIDTSLGKLPGPAQVYTAAQGLVTEHREERGKQFAFYERQKERHAKELAEDPKAEIKVRKYAGKPTYFDQIKTSLFTVFAGFLIATMIAVPTGIICGLNRTIMTALNPLIQIFKPVSPLAWLPIVTMVVSAVYTTNDGIFPKSFINSAITVALCSMWPSMINTALGVSSIDKDYINVAQVLQLGFFPKVFKIVLPASLPLIFTGLRISLGVGWMVLIAAEMLAQNPGLGKFVWDEFQNGSSYSLARIMVAVFTIGIIGFMLDRVMVFLHKSASFGQEPATA
jgi:nitrate/nitrite transport system permease protein